MRNLVLALLAAISIAGCSGTRESTPVAYDPGNTPEFNLPLPFELDAIAGPLGSTPAGPDSKSTSRLVRTPGSIFMNARPNSNATKDTIAYTATLQGSMPDLAYCMYGIDPDDFGLGQQISALWLDFEWTGAAPTGDEGIWVGFADYYLNRWRWFGPFDESGDWLDTSTESLMGRELYYCYMAVVNYSSVDATVKALNYRFTRPEQIMGDEWVYYTHFDPLIPTYKTSISRARPAGGTPESMLEGDTDQGYSRPRVVKIEGGDPMLVFRNQAPTEDRMGKVVLDLGTPPTWMRSSPIGLIPGGWNPAGTIYFWMEDSGSGNYNLYAENLDLLESGRISRLQDNIVEAEWDHLFSGTTYPAVITYVSDVPPDPPRNVVSTMRDVAPLTPDNTPGGLVEAGAEIAQNPASLVILNGLGGVGYGYLFAIKDRDDATFNLYSWLASDLPFVDTITPLLVDPAYDFTSPVLSPDNTTLAFIASTPGADRGTLYVMDFWTGSLATATPLADEVTGKLAWYDPTP